MKQLYILFGGLLLAGGMMAQSAQAPSSTHVNRQPASTQTKQKVTSALYRTSSSQSTQSTYHAFLSHTDGAINFIDPGNASSTFTLYLDGVFQDSSVQSVYSNGTFHITTQKAGGVFDPKSTQEFPGMNLNATTPYTIDTVWIGGNYTIIPAHAAAGDTLQVELTWGLQTPTPAYFQGLVITAQNEAWTMPLNTTSLLMGNHSFSTATAANKMVLKRVLTAADTGSNNPNYPYIDVVPATPISIPANNIVAVQYTLIPKAAYANGDIYFDGVGNTATMNSFNSLIWEETALASTGGSNYFYDPTSQGTSGNLNNTSRYGQWPAAQSFLNGCMLPYTNDGYIWAMSISASSGAGIATNDAAGLSLDQNMPNPSNGNTIVNYSMNDAGNVFFTINDITGKELMNVNEGKQTAGAHQVEFNTSNLPAGVYSYTLNVDGKRLTKRMVISE